MSNELVPANLGGEMEKFDFDSVASNSSTYLARLQLFGSKSDACAEGRINIGHWGLVSDDVITDVGKEVDVAIISWRPKALRTGGDDLIIEYDQKSDVFQQIIEDSSVKDSGCMYGPEFLVYVPSQKAFATYFMSSKTARRESKKMKPLMRKAATLKCRLIETARFKWHGPVIVPCSTPLEMPSLDDLKTQIEAFQNPPKDDREVAEEDSSGREH